MVAGELWQNSIIGIIIFLYGIVIGSFLNVCILRIPLKESLSRERSHCMSCGYQLRWYDLIPLFSYLFLGGRCRNCREHISMQYPLVEALNGIVYVLIFTFNGWSIDAMIYCLFLSSLIVFGVMDIRAYDIPYGMDSFWLALGLIHLWCHLGDWVDCIISLLAAGILSEAVYRMAGRDRIRYAYVRLMRVAAFLMGWRLWGAALIVGCVLEIITHIIRKNIKHKTRNKMSVKGHTSTFGACLSVGIFVTVVWGEWLWSRYIGLLPVR